MSAYEVTDEAIRRIRSGQYDFMILNFANCDMVGHTGVIPAAIAAVKAVDECVGRVVGAVLEAGGRCIVTADHRQRGPDGSIPRPANPLPPIRPIPFPSSSATRRASTPRSAQGGRLADIAPTRWTWPACRSPRR